MHKIFLVLFFVLISSFSLSGDVLRENYLLIKTSSNNLEAVLDFESDYLDKTIKTDINNNEIVSWKELKSKKEEIISYVLKHIKISSDFKECKPVVKNFVVHRLVQQSYIKLFMEYDCPSPKNILGVKYDLFFDIDKSEKLFITVDNNLTKKAEILSFRKNSIDISLQQKSFLSTFFNFLVEGIWHILIGYDHILFVLMLLVSSISNSKKILFDILKIITAFSIAHSITLALSVLDVVKVDIYLIEILIALSVLVTALNNIFKVIKKDIWIVAFFFGLIHGFGFATVLKEMILTTKALASSLVGFNLGVEIGQIGIVLILIPILYHVKKSFLFALSVLTALISIFWIYERL